MKKIELNIIEQLILECIIEDKIKAIPMEVHSYNDAFGLICTKSYLEILKNKIKFEEDEGE